MPNDSQDSYYPPASFLFELWIEGISQKDDCCFQEIGGINIDIKTEEVREGGINSFVHRLPKNVNYSNLVLKRGFLKKSSLILDWIKKELEEFIYSPRNIKVKLLDRDGAPLVTWSFNNAYPVAMKIGDFKTNENSYVVETLEFAYNSFERTDS